MQTGTMLIDTHAHLTDKRFDKDRQQIIRQCEQDGVVCIINIGSDISSSIKSIALSDQYPFIYAAVGIHPHNAKTMDENSVEVLKSLAKKDKVIAIGEIGLDYHYDFSPREQQKTAFRQQLYMARELELPVVIHDRDAHRDTLDILNEQRGYEVSGVMHCFSGSNEIARECMDIGLYISFAGPVTFSNAKKLKQAVKYVPLDRILIETDCPYLTPVPHRGERNYPGYVKFTAEEICKIKGISMERLMYAVTDNVKQLFRICF